MKESKGEYKILVMAILLAGVCFLSYYFHAVVKVEVIFTHFFYIPIILAALWWKRKGLLVAIFLALALTLSHIILRPDVPATDDCFRALIFLAIAFVVAMLSERLTKSEEALRQTRNYLESLLNYANAPIIVWNPGFSITRFNRAFEHLTSYTADEVIGQELGMLFPEASRDELLSKIALTLNGEYWEWMEIPIVCRDGDTRLVLWNSANIYAKDGTTVLATIAQGTDITERRAAEEALAASKAYAESIIQNFLDTLIVVDAEAKIRTVNPATCHLLGYTDEEIIGQPISILFAEEVRRVFQFFRQSETVETLRPKDNIRNRELTYKTKDGRLIPMLFNASVLTDEGGNVIDVVAGAKDITELKLAEIEIRRQKVFSENIIATVPDSLLVLDKDLRVKSANRSFYRLFQTKPEEVVGSKIGDILGDEDGKLSAKLTKLFRTEDVLQNFELHYRSAKLGERILNITARGIIFAEEEEEEEEELVVIQDITERKRAVLERQVMYEITHGVNITSNLDELLKLIHTSLQKVIYAENCFVALHDQNTGLFSFPYFVDKFDPTPMPMAMRKSCTAYVFRTGKPLLLTQELFERLVEQNKVELVGTNSPSWLGVPLLTPSRTIGVLVLQHYEEESVYSEQDVEFLDSVGNQIALAIERKRAEDEIKRRNQELSVLHTIDKAVNETLDLDQILKVAIEKTMEFLDADTGGIFLLQEDGKTMRFVVHRGLSDEFVKNVETIQLGEGISGRAASERKPVIVDIAHYPSKRLAPFIIKEGVQSLIGIPLLAKDRVLGAISIGSRKPDAFPENKIDTLLSIGIQIGVAIQNAELLIIEQRKAKQLMTINRIGQNIASFMDIEKLFLRVVKLLHETFGYSYVTLAVVDEKANEIIYKAAAGYNIAELKKSNEKLGEEGIIQWVALSGNPLLTNDVSKEPRFLYCDVFKHSRSELTLPIMLRNKVVAVLDIQNDKLNAFNPDDLSTFETVARDISVAIENAQLYEELRGTTNYLESLITYANAPIIVWNLERKITIFNRAFEKLSGYRSDEVINCDLEILFPPADKEEILKTIDQAIKGKRWETVEIPIQRKDGERRIALWNSAGIIDKDGNIIATIAQGQDITERKQAEQQIKTLMEGMPDGVLVVNSKGNIIVANTHAGVMFGYKLEEILGKSIEMLLPERVRSIHPMHRKEFLKNQETRPMGTGQDYFALRRDGSEFPVDISLSTVETMDGIVVISIIRDITERKRAEQEIISQKNRFAQLFENSPIAIVLLDDQDKVVHINESFSALFGYYLEEIKGKDLDNIIVPPELQEEAKSYSDQTREGNQINKESYRKKKNGTLVCVQIVGVPVNINDKTVGIYGMYVDLTQRKEAEDKMKSAKELAEQSDKLKSEFLAQMSHEIRTPINVIYGNVDYLNDSFREKMDSEVRESFDSINLSSKRIIRTIDLILNVAELQTSGYKPQFVKTDLNSDIINRLYKEHQLSAKQKGLELIYKCELKETKVLADEYSVTQIFANLIDNAIKFTKKGKVEILLDKNSSGNIMVEIKDTGIGMSKEFMTRMFEPFVQEDKGFTRAYEGNGLGLALVKRYCDLNGITIEVESMKGEGTKFTLIFTDIK